MAKKDVSKVAKTKAPKKVAPKKEAKVKKEKKVKDPNAPKRSLSPYLIYTQDRRAGLLKERPQLGHKDVIAELAKEWRGLTDADKVKYNLKAETDKARYQKEKEAYEKKK